MDGLDKRVIELPPTPTETFTVGVRLIAPPDDGQYESIWQVQDGDGNPLSDELSVSIAVRTPPTSTPNYPPPELLGIDIVGCNVTFKWTWPWALADDEWFAVRVGRVGIEPPLSKAWTKENTYIYPLKDGGEYSWMIVVCKGEPAEGHCEELSTSNQESFSFGGCSQPPPPPP
jgi:hypothetical protein